MIQRFFAVTLFFIGFFVFNLTLAGQTPPDTLSFTTDTLLVQAVRTSLSFKNAPLAISLKNRSDRELSGNASVSLSSITQQLPGIWVNNRHNQALGERITIRGLGWRAAFGVRGIQVVLDGIPLTVADGQSVTNLIDPAFITRAELIRGPAGSYWGNSSGGILYLSSENASDKPAFYLRTQAGSFGYEKADFRYSQNAGNHNFSGYSSYQIKHGYREYSASRLFRSGLHGRYGLSAKDHIEYTAALLVMPQAQHPSGLTEEQVRQNPQQANDAFVAADAGKEVTQGQIGTSYIRDTVAGLVTLTGYGIYRNLSNPLPFGIITVDRLAGGFRGTVEKEFNRLQINGGAEVKIQHDDREEFENDNGGRGPATVNQVETVFNEALFATASHALGEVTLLGGLRYDRITFASDSASNTSTAQRTFQSISPSMGISYNPGNLTFYSNLSTSFEAPTTTELVNRPDGGNGFNPGLKPEQTVGWELGSRGSLVRGLITYDIAIYKLWIHNLLFPYQQQTDGPVFYRNQGKTRHSGIEASAYLYPSSSLSLGLTYTLTRATFEKARTLEGQSLKNNYIPGVPEHRLAGELTLSDGPLWIKIAGEFIDTYPVNNLNTAYNNKYFNLDTKFSYQLSFPNRTTTLTPFLNINNMLDARYNSSVVVNAFGGRYFEPAPGRNWQAGMSLNF